ncbi:adenylate/guanylate cyclase domain-containing protein [Mycobacterium sp. 852002-51163_SCH5372311]|uniref:ATP-binding protein n=1 Tax=Mycobacterium sp. 852002-51163_SCH5372311 TaxID=1834097 RepID=UPI001E4F7052|nr:adenylate/guanylate cyclase domain-containing protein [Mycobacterium sp. 852002-51163_SCH5372311]
MSAEKAVPPSGLVTFLFTDVEGSTRRWEADADAMRTALAAHDELLRKTIEAHGGWLFKHTGDGVCAAFGSPRSAIDAAVAAQRELALPVRMGIATGEAELRGDDYFGAVLNRAARVMAAGHGGQILVAESTAGLLSGVDLVNLGPRRLRDLPTPVAVSQVRAPGLRTDFPPLRALDTSPGNLRPAVNSLIGRESDIAAVEAAVRGHRLVTLTGVGGVGKTRLALEVAGRLSDEFPDGVWLFELAAVADPAAVPDAVAAVLGITQQPGKSVAENVAATLEGRIRLLVFDNCEHLRDAVADLIETILGQSATVRVLATSREGLGIADEQLWLVPSLDVIAGLDCAAVALFVERARSVAAGFSVEAPDEATAVIEVCRRLDGIPLAIELAASRMASMTAGEVRDRLDQRFRLLVGSRRGLERHQTLRHAVAWSYEHLDDDEKQLLDRCAVFAGGFDLESVCAVTGTDDTDEFAVLDLLDALVRKSLLVADRTSGRTRYSMLETIRQFAEEQLVARGEAAAARTAHARYFAGREADILDAWDSPRQREAYNWFATEQANLRAAFRWAADCGDLDSAARIATFAPLLGAMVENYEPIAWTEELIEPARAVDHPRLAALYTLASWCYLTGGRLEEAIRYCDAGQIVVADIPNLVLFGFETWLGGVYNFIGQPERSVEWTRFLLARGPDPYANIRAGLVFGLLMAGSHAEAVAVAKDVLDAADVIANPWALSFALLTYGIACSDVDPGGAREAMRRGLTVAQESGNRYNETHLANLLGRLEARYGDPLTALDYLALAIRNYHDSGNTTIMRVPLVVLAALLDRLGREQPAAIIAGYAFSSVTESWTPEISPLIAHLRDVLGDQSYGSLARSGASMTATGIAACAFDQIDQARAELIARQ